MLHPIDDGFSEKDPNHKRSSAFAATKGLTTNEKAAAKAPSSTLSTPNSELDAQSRAFGPLIPVNPRSRTPESTGIPVPFAMRSKTPLTYSESTNGGSELRTVASHSSTHSSQRTEGSTKRQGQGNIKKKRRSLMMGELSHPAENLDSENTQPDSPVMGPSRLAEYGNSEKAGRILGLEL
jgi:glutamine amidotransferase